jgi:hypothetical protein
VKRDNWIVGDNGIRPVSRDANVCTYCREPRGNTHKPDCVIRSRSVVVRLTVEYVKLVPESFDEEMVNFVANEGTRCIDNSIHELNERSVRWEEQARGDEGPEVYGISCFCGHASEVYVREANEHDEQVHGVYVAKAEG